MALVCGIDSGSAKTFSYVAWLDTETKGFVLDTYLPDLDGGKVLPTFSRGTPTYIGIDCPQGLPAQNAGRLCRMSDQAAKTPTKRMAFTRDELESGNLYGRELVRLGIDLFWTLYSTKQAAIYGLANGEVDSTHKLLSVAFETYPRFALERLFGLKPSIKNIPSKRKDPVHYMEKIWG